MSKAQGVSFRESGVSGLQFEDFGLLVQGAEGLMLWEQERPWLETLAIPLATTITDAVTATLTVATIITTSLGS